MFYPSRHRRPVRPRPFEVQPRDRAVLAAIAHHRYLLAEHLHALVFAGSSLRRTQARLRGLWEHGFVDRIHVPLQRDGRTVLSPPLYCLATKGAKLVGGDINVAWRSLPHTPKQNTLGFATLLHHMVATDVLVAAECCSSSAAPVTTVRETTLRQALADARKRGRWKGSALVPDGAIVIGGQSPQAGVYYLEVVRAGVKSGNQLLRRKLELYVRLQHQRYFATAFGHDHVRAVLILTTSPERAERFRQLAARLPYGQRLFWFGAYTPSGAGTLKPAIDPRATAEKEWTTTDHRAVALLNSQWHGFSLTNSSALS